MRSLRRDKNTERIEKEVLGPSLTGRGRLSVLLFMGAVFVITLGITSGKYRNADYYETGIHHIQEYTKLVQARIYDRIGPAIERTKKTAEDPEIIELLQAGNRGDMVRWLDQKITQCTEIDLAAIISPDGHPLAINTIDSSSRPFPQGGATSIYNTSFADRDIVSMCLGSDEQPESTWVGFFDKCLLSEAYFTGSHRGRSVGISHQIRSADGKEILGVLTTRFRFDNLSEIVDDLELDSNVLDIAFITGNGQALTPVGLETEKILVSNNSSLESIVKPLESSNLREISIKNKDHAILLHSLSGYNLVDGGKLLTLVTVGPEFFNSFESLANERNYTIATALSLLVGLFMWKIRESNRRQKLLEHITRVETETKHQNQKLMGQARELEAAKESALRAAKAKGDFLATMSHELRTPINGIVGSLCLLRQRQLTEEQLEYINTASACSKSLLQVISEILDFSKLEAGRLELEKIQFNILQEFDELIRIFKNQARGKKLIFSAEYDERVPVFMMGDPARLRQVIMNLLSNAFKFTDSGEVRLSISPCPEHYGNTDTDRYYKIAVTDTGIGIPADRSSRLFESFSQMDSSTTRQYGGTGLGLAICKQLCELMGGEIRHEPNPDGGSIFWFTFRTGVPESPPSPYGEVLVKARTKKIAVLGHPAPVCALFRIFEIPYDHIHESAEVEQFLETASNKPTDYEFVFMAPESIKDGLLKNFSPAGFSLSVGDGAMWIAYGRNLSFEKGGYVCHQRLSEPVYPTLVLEILGRKEGYIQSPCSARGVFRTVSKNSPGADNIDFTDCRILLVEDNLVNQKVSCSFLKKLKADPDIAVNGKEAVEMAGKIEYDLILMDCMMPQMDGYEATRTIRADKSSPSNRTPIVAMTANAMQGDREKCLSAGMDDYLPKPIHFDDMKAMVKKWICQEIPQACEIAMPARPQTEVDEFCEIIGSR